MFQERDKIFLSELEGQGDTISIQSLRCFMRRGDLLMALPFGRRPALKTLSIYQPQSLVAKFYTRIIKALIWLGMAGVALRPVKLEIKESSPLAEIVRQGELGFLLGNPHGRARRIVCLHKGNDDQWLVTKIGMKGAGRQTVEDEAENLRNLPDHLDGPPQVSSALNVEDYASYTVELIEGKSPGLADSSLVLGCLVSWQTDELVHLGQLPLWQKLSACVEDASDKAWLDKITRLQVYPSVVHGDFAPWNIKIDRSGHVHVLDWEFCLHGGAAGWDWAHYLIQVGLLVEKCGSAEVLKKITKWAQSQEGREYLEMTGWGDEIDAWIGSYLLYTHYLLKHDRKELITCWKKNK